MTGIPIAFGANGLGHFDCMEDRLPMMEAALRVLTALVDMRQAYEPDVEKLRRYAPLPAETPLSELACEVLQHDLKERDQEWRSP